MFLRHRLDQQLRKPRVVARKRLPPLVREHEELLGPSTRSTGLARTDEAVAHQRSKVLANRGASDPESLPELVHCRTALVAQQVPEQLPAPFTEYLGHVASPLIDRDPPTCGDAIRSPAY